jgi:hypothetical protein
MCVSPLSGLGLAGSAVKKAGPLALLSPALALSGVLKKKKHQPRFGGGPNADGSISLAGG